jgi:hypothetical protein
MIRSAQRLGINKVMLFAAPAGPAVLPGRKHRQRRRVSAEIPGFGSIHPSAFRIRLGKSRPTLHPVCCRASIFHRSGCRRKAPKGCRRGDRRRDHRIRGRLRIATSRWTVPGVGRVSRNLGRRRLDRLPERKIEYETPAHQGQHSHEDPRRSLGIDIRGDRAVVPTRVMIRQGEASFLTGESGRIIDNNHLTTRRIALASPRRLTHRVSCHGSSLLHRKERRSSAESAP